MSKNFKALLILRAYGKYLVVLVTLFATSFVAAQEATHWKCPVCEACVEPIKLSCPGVSTTTKSTTNYSMKCEDICLSSPDPCGNCVSKFVSCHLPSTWQAWSKFTMGIVREKRSLQKIVDSKEVKTVSCEVVYQCPCCHEKFKPEAK